MSRNVGVAQSEWSKEILGVLGQRENFSGTASIVHGGAYLVAFIWY